MANAGKYVVLELCEHEADRLAALLRSASWSKGEGEVFADIWEELAELDYRGDNFLISVDETEGEVVIESVTEAAPDSEPVVQ